jgi:hypothetical protein
MAGATAANYVFNVEHGIFSGTRKSGQQSRRTQMLRHSLIATAFALATITSSAVPGSAATANVSGHPHHRTVVHHVYTYEPAPSPYYYGYYGPYYGPGYAPAYAPAAPITALPGAAVCLAFSLIGAC